MIELTLNGIQDGTGKIQYRGMHILKCPFDFMMYSMIVTEIKPDLIIEIGTYGGGSAVYLADLLETNGKGEIHTIDIFPEITPAMSNGKTHFVDHPRIKYFGEGYQGYDLSNAEGFDTVMVIDDGIHVYEDVLAALEKFNDLVSLNSYYIVEDGIVNDMFPLDNRWNGGPLRATRQFLKDNSNFEVDRKYCDMFGKNTTWNPDGYLKRIN